MAVNKVDAGGGRINLQGDYIIHHQGDVEFSLEGDRLPTFLKGSYKGELFLSNLRIIFVNNGSSGYNSFSMDFQYVRNVEVKQPIFGANYLAGFVMAEPDGGWQGNANFKAVFNKGGLFEYAEKFQKQVKEAVRFRQAGVVPAPPQPNPAYFVPPTAGMYYPQSAPGMYYPSYGPPPPGVPPYGAYGQPPPGVYAQPAPGVYGQPPPGVSSQAPSPYPNPGPIQQAGQPLGAAAPSQPPPPYYVPPSGTQHYPPENNPKAQEAYMSGNNVYVPTDQGPPPPYAPGYDKKGQ